MGDRRTIAELYRNLSFESSEALLIRLHESMRDGEETPKADRLRDGLQVLDHDLTRAQREYLRGLSGDLHQLEDDEVPLRTEPKDRLGRGFERTVREALGRGMYGEVLRLIRTDENPYDDERRAYLRGLGYGGLGRYAPAFRFMERAARSGKLVHRYLALEYLIRSDETRASEVGWQIIEDENAYPALRVQAAWAVIVPTRTMLPEEAREPWIRMTAFLPPLIEGEASRALPRPVLALGLLATALCHEMLGDVHEAVRYCLEGFFVDPGNTSVVDSLRIHLPAKEVDAMIRVVQPVVERSGLEFVDTENDRIFAMAA